jgi:hypothetical protein
MGIFDGQFPSQEYLGAILVAQKVCHPKAAATSLNDGVRLTRIKYHNRTPGEWDSKARRWEMQVQPPVLAQEEIAKSHAAIVCGVMVVPCPEAGHQGHITGGKHLMQTERARPIRHRLHTVAIVRPTGTRSRQRQGLYVARFQTQA